MSGDAFTQGVADVLDLGGAADHVEELLTQIPSGASPDVRAHAHRVAATAQRLAGRHEAAQVHLDAAHSLDASDGVRADIALEASALALTRGDADAARMSLDRARLFSTRAGGLPEVEQRIAARTVLLSAVADGSDAARAGLFEGLGQHIGEVLETAGGPSPAVQSLVRALEEAVDHQDDAALSHLAEADERARGEQDEATYVVTKLTESALLERRGDRVGCFGALAVGWATLRVASGDEPARAAFQPAVVDLRERWGPAEFEAVAAEFHTR